ncbi:hypothetical protein D3C78_1656900 [compost metagenome]
MHFQAPFAQALRHQVGRARFLEGQFRVRVDVAAQGGQFRVRAFDFGNGFHGVRFRLGEFTRQRRMGEARQARQKKGSAQRA